MAHPAENIDFLLTFGQIQKYKLWLSVTPLTSDGGACPSQLYRAFPKLLI